MPSTTSATAAAEIGAPGRLSSTSAGRPWAEPARDDAAELREIETVALAIRPDTDDDQAFHSPIPAGASTVRPEWALPLKRFCRSRPRNEILRAVAEQRQHRVGKSQRVGDEHHAVRRLKARPNP